MENNPAWATVHPLDGVLGDYRNVGDRVIPDVVDPWLPSKRPGILDLGGSGICLWRTGACSRNAGVGRRADRPVPIGLPLWNGAIARSINPLHPGVPATILRGSS